jgi:cytochrome c-type biogenesis protein CcmH
MASMTAITPRIAYLASAAAALAVATALYVSLVGSQGLFTAGPARSAQETAAVKKINAAAVELAASLQGNPGDTESWIMLGHSYATTERHAEAAAAYAKAVEQRPADAQLLADYAYQLALVRGRDFAGEPDALIARALKADRNNIKALALAASVAFERRDYPGAIEHWRRMLPLTSEQSRLGKSVRSSIASAQSRMEADKP